MTTFPIQQSDYEFRIFEDRGYCELQTTTRLLNCELWPNTKEISVTAPSMSQKKREEYKAMEERINQMLKKEGFDELPFGPISPQNWTLIIPRWWWNIAPEEQAYAFWAILKGLTEKGFSYKKILATKPDDVLIFLIR